MLTKSIKIVLTIFCLFNLKTSFATEFHHEPLSDERLYEYFQGIQQIKEVFPINIQNKINWDPNPYYCRSTKGLFLVTNTKNSKLEYLMTPFGKIDFSEPRLSYTIESISKSFLKELNQKAVLKNIPNDIQLFTHYPEIKMILSCTFLESTQRIQQITSINNLKFEENDFVLFVKVFDMSSQPDKDKELYKNLDKRFKSEKNLELKSKL